MKLLLCLAFLLFSYVSFASSIPIFYDPAFGTLSKQNYVIKGVLHGKEVCGTKKRAFSNKVTLSFQLQAQENSKDLIKAGEYPLTQTGVGNNFVLEFTDKQKDPSMLHAYKINVPLTSLFLSSKRQAALTNFYTLGDNLPEIIGYTYAVYPRTSASSKSGTVEDDEDLSFVTAISKSDPKAAIPGTIFALFNRLASIYVSIQAQSTDRACVYTGVIRIK